METRIGDNQPPDMTVTAAETMTALSDWLSEHPVIQTMEEAREAKVYIDRAKLCIKDLEDERTRKTGPLNEAVKEINNYYRLSNGSLESVLGILQQRVGSFVRAEEVRREAEAQAARESAAKLEQAAREAERIEQEKIESAQAGELGIDIGAEIQKANEAFKEYEKAARVSAIAEREAHVKIGGGFSKAISLRQKETLIVVDANAAIVQLGLTEDISKAIIKSARAYRKLRGKLPAGVTAEYREEL